MKHEMGDGNKPNRVLRTSYPAEVTEIKHSSLIREATRSQELGLITSEKFSEYERLGQTNPTPLSAIMDLPLLDPDIEWQSDQEILKRKPLGFDPNNEVDRREFLRALELRTTLLKYLNDAFVNQKLEKEFIKDVLAMPDFKVQFYIVTNMQKESTLLAARLEEAFNKNLITLDRKSEMEREQLINLRAAYSLELSSLSNT